MPAAVPLVAAAAGAVAAAGASSVLATTITSAFALKLVSGLIGGVVSFGVNAALAGKPKRPAEIPLARVAQGRTEELIDSLAPHRVILGRVRVAGALVFVHTKAEGGRPNALLYQVLVLAAHEVESIGDILLNDEGLADPKFQNVARVEWRRGTATQSALELLASEIGDVWTADHRALGRAVLGCRFTYDEAVFRAGRPKVTAIVRGVRDVYDPRTGATGWTDNPALLAAWYLTRPYGYAVPDSRIDWPSVAEAANVCDERVALKAGGTEARYTCNGTFTLDQERSDIMTGILSAMAGTAAPTLGGKWVIRAGAWRPVSTEIDADWLRGPVTVQANRPSRDLFNLVRATYVRPQANWQAVDAPPRIDAAALAADGGDEVAETIEMPFTTSGTMAQRLMQQALRRNRAGRRVTLSATLRGLVVTPGDTVALTLPRLPRATWRVVERAVAEDGAGVDLVLEEETPDLYAWSVDDEKPLSTTQDVTLPDGAFIAAPVLTITPPTAPVPASIATSWTAVAAAASYTLAWRAPGGEWTDTTQAGTTATIATGGRAAFRVRAVRADGAVSNWRDAAFPPELVVWQVIPISGVGFSVTWQGGGAVQVFAGATDVFTAATLRSQTPVTDGRVDVSAAAGALFVWLRRVSAEGVVGAAVGPVEIVSQSNGNAAGGGIPDGPGGEGSGGGEGGGADGGGGDGGGDG